MRDIRFRAWNQEKKEWVNPDEDCLIIFLDGTLGNVDSGCWDSGVTTNKDLNSKFILMQFTGLKDKNGVEIYEGDILKITEDHIYLAPVIEDLAKWTIDLYQAKQVKNPADWGLSHDKVKTEGFRVHWHPTGYHGLHNIYRDSEIIGNIYESPELLETNP